MKKGKSNGAKALVKALEKRETEIIFGYPGGANLPIYEALSRTSIRHVLAGHEQGAAHMADGYARATGKTGVCLATSGPGATNLVTGLATAYMDSAPVIGITGQVPRAMIGNDAFQEVDITGITIPITKHNYLVQKAAQVAPVVEEAFYLAGSGRKGTILIDIPKDVLQEEYSECEEKRASLEGYNPTIKGHPGQIKRAVGMIKESIRPVIIAGGGIFIAGAFDAFKDFITTTGIPMVYTLMGKSAMNNRDPNNLGLFGYHGRKVANRAVSEADLIIAVGTRFGDRSTGPLNSFAKHSKIIHIDIDPAEIGKNVPAFLPIAGDINDVLPRLTKAISTAETKNRSEDRSSTESTVKSAQGKSSKPSLNSRLVKEKWISGLVEESEKNQKNGIPDQFCTRSILAIAEKYFSDPILATDVGRHQMYAAQFFPVSGGRNFISSGGLGTMGFGLPAAIGAALGRQDKKVLLVTGDGSFLMNCQELVTAANTEINLTILIIHDGRLGMIQQLQDAFYGARFDYSRFSSDVRFDRLAESLGCRGIRVSTKSDLETALSACNTAVGPGAGPGAGPETGSRTGAATRTGTGTGPANGVTVIDCMIEEESNVYPMVTGATLMDSIEGEA